MFYSQQHMHKPLLISASTLFVLSVLSGCQTIDLQQATYETLRQYDCKQNKSDDFCNRGYHQEYREYQRLRQEYIDENLRT